MQVCYSAQMNHRKVLVFRDALANLVESLEALIQLASGKLPEPISPVASKLQARLASAGRLAAGKFAGTPAEAAFVTAICGRITKLESAYVDYCREIRHSESPERALRGLESAIEDARKGLA
jgi:hypothetical protein